MGLPKINGNEVQRVATILAQLGAGDMRNQRGDKGAEGRGARAPLFNEGRCYWRLPRETAFFVGRHGIKAVLLMLW